MIASTRLNRRLVAQPQKQTHSQTTQARQGVNSAQKPGVVDPAIKPDITTIAKAIGDTLRTNILQVLAHDSFGVLELGTIFHMAQPAISHHLKILLNTQLVSRRREGTNLFYQRIIPPADSFLHRLLEEVDTVGIPPPVAREIAKVHKARIANSTEFFRDHAEALAQQTQLICAPDVYVDAVVQSAVTTPNIFHTALEVGPGDGTLIAALAGYYESVYGVDLAQEMLDETTVNTLGLKNIQLIQADFLKLPRIRKYNLITAAMVLHHMSSPVQFFQCSARVLKKNGMVVVAELCAHNHDWVKSLCGDIWLGFEPAQLDRWAKQAGFAPIQQQFLAQRNGFRVQVNAYQLAN